MSRHLSKSDDIALTKRFCDSRASGCTSSLASRIPLTKYRAVQWAMWNLGTRSRTFRKFMWANFSNRRYIFPISPISPTCPTARESTRSRESREATFHSSKDPIGMAKRIASWIAWCPEPKCTFRPICVHFSMKNWKSSKAEDSSNSEADCLKLGNSYFFRMCSNLALSDCQVPDVEQKRLCSFQPSRWQLREQKCTLLQAPHFKRSLPSPLKRRTVSRGTLLHSRRPWCRSSTHIPSERASRKIAVAPWSSRWQMPNNSTTSPFSAGSSEEHTWHFARLLATQSGNVAAKPASSRSKWPCTMWNPAHRHPWHRVIHKVVWWSMHRILLSTFSDIIVSYDVKMWRVTLGGRSHFWCMCKSMSFYVHGTSRTCQIWNCTL